MTFPLQKPGGWTDDIDTITGQQITNIDINLSNALDGANGGLYAPAARIEIGGVGGLDIQNGINTTMTGPITLSGPTAGIRHRVDRSTIVPAAVATQFIIDTSSDIYMATAPCQALCEVALNITNGGYEAPVEGNRIVIQKFPENPALLDIQDILVKQDTVLGATLLVLPALTALVAPSGNTFVVAEFVFNAAVGWEVLRCHPQCTP